MAQKRATGLYNMPRDANDQLETTTVAWYKNASTPTLLEFVVAQILYFLVSTLGVR